MAKETKNLLTREACKKDLKKPIKTAMLINLAILPVALFAFVVFLFASLSLMEQALIFGILMVAVCAVMLASMLFIYFSPLWLFHLINKGEYSIVTDKVFRIAKGERVRRRRHTIEVNALYFSKYGRYVPSSFVFNMADVDDEFFLVIMHTKKKPISLAYHTSMYDCKEISTSL